MARRRLAFATDDGKQQDLTNRLLSTDVWKIVSHERRAIKARQEPEAEGGRAMTTWSDAFAASSGALSVTADVQAGSVGPEAAHLIASHLWDDLPKLIQLLGSSDVCTLVRHLKQQTSR